MYARRLADYNLSEKQDSMNISVVQNAVGELQRILGKARDALTQIEAEAYSGQDYVGYEHPDEALAGHLDDLQQMLMVVLEAADLRDTRAALNGAWATFKKQTQGLKTVVNDAENDYMYSLALNYVDRLIQTLRACVDKGLASAESTELDRLEWILDATAVLVHRRGEFPSGELTLQPIMHDYLSAAFPSFVKRFRIPGGLKNFEPDCGIRELSAAIEFKIVHTKADVAKAISGVIEDIGGYRGSKDWTRFYSVFYQANPFMTAKQVQKELRRAGGTAWTAFVVNGLTKAKPTRKAKTLKSIAKNS